jgi:type VI secretion system secreted protein Hcp
MAAVDYFIKFDGIKGESADAKHKDEIDVESWSWGETHAGTASSGGGGGAGKVSMQDFHFVMRLNKASPGLMKACATGQHIKTATLSARKAGKGQLDYLTFKFHDVLVSSIQTGGSEDTDVLPTDQVSFNFAKLEVEYKPEKADGSLGLAVQFRYDLKANKTF